MMNTHTRLKHRIPLCFHLFANPKSLFLSSALYRGSFLSLLSHEMPERDGYSGRPFLLHVNSIEIKSQVKHFKI